MDTKPELTRGSNARWRMPQTMQGFAPMLLRVARRIAQPIISRVLTSESIIVNPYISGKYLPVQQGAPFFILETVRADDVPSDGALPVPPEHLWEGWGPHLEDYLESGREDMKSMLRILQAAGEDPLGFRRVLDFGCAAGRMLRFFPNDSNAERWGVDIKAKHIVWCQQHLSPPFRFVTTTTMPHLPFEDNYFDLVYCGSVFTHMSELADAWFLELMRVLRKGGYAYVTIHDKNTVKILLGAYRNRSDHAPLINALLSLHHETGVLDRDYAYFAINTEPRTQVFYDSDFLQKKWGNFARIVSVNPAAMDYQTAVLAQKTSGGNQMG
jgi:ubiquinone/menaquinone biosynthesis C-methylase UbiE